MATELPHISAVLTGGQDGPRPSHGPIVTDRPAARNSTGVAAGPWPAWASSQLEQAVVVASAAPDHVSVATLLYREWFNPIAGDVDVLRTQRPLAGIYRSAHAGSAARLRADGVSVVRRHDVVRVDGWWRTWGDEWSPPRSRPGSLRLLFTPQPDRLADFVATVTGRLLSAAVPWSLGCAIEPRRIARYGSAVLDLPALDTIPDGMLADLEPMLRPVAPPLCLPLAPGVGAAGYPDNGMTFGEHRCHLVALALRHPSSARHPLRTIAAAFAAHGIDPAAPHEARRG
jgi:hypothetical protein